MKCVYLKCQFRKVKVNCLLKNCQMQQPQFQHWKGTECSGDQVNDLTSTLLHQDSHQAPPQGYQGAPRTDYSSHVQKMSTISTGTNGNWLQYEVAEIQFCLNV